MIQPRLLDLLRRRFALDWNGTHGGRHWGRVRENGLRLAPLTGARPAIVELFAVLHDSQRRNEWHDDDHGPRAADFARGLPPALLGIGAADLDLLCFACRHHADGFMDGDITVRTCWDADRLDFGRTGVRVDPRRLCTEAARGPALLEWAQARALADAEPDEPLGPAAGRWERAAERARAVLRLRRG